MKVCSLLIALFFSSHVWAQSALTLADCQIGARLSSPIAEQFMINKSLEKLELLNLSRNNYPKLQIRGQASYQSDVFQLPIEFPGFDPPIIPKDQYQLYLEVNQNLFDGGYTRHSKASQQRALEVQNQSVEVELFRIQEIINQLFFSALILQENSQLIETVVDQLTEQHKIIKSRVENGVVITGAEAILRKEILEQEKALLEIELQRESVMDMLASWIEKELDDQALLVLPAAETGPVELTLKRPEQRLFTLQQEKLEVDKKAIGSTLVPKFSAFGQVGMGSPNKFNPFDVPLTSFYLVGVGLAWNPWDWGTVNRKKEMLQLNQQAIMVKKRDFEKTLGTALIGDYSEINKLTKLIEKDEEIIVLQEEIVKQAFSQFSNGVISSTDYVAEVHSETRAKLTLKIHQVQLAKARINLLTHSGNLEFN